MSKQYEMPPVELGDVVFWYDGGDRHQVPAAAMVTDVGQDTLCLNVFDKRSYNLRIRDGVRHLDDPRTKQSELMSQGAWDHTPATARRRALEARLAKLEQDLGANVSAVMTTGLVDKG